MYHHRPRELREETEKEQLETFTLYLSHQQLHDTSGSPVDNTRGKQKYFWWFCRLCHQMLDYLNKIMQTFIINIKSEKIDHLTLNIFYIKTWKTESEWVGRKNFWKTLSEGERLDIWSSLIFFQFSLPVNFSLHITISSTLVTLLNCLARGWIWENISEPQLENFWTDWK